MGQQTSQEIIPQPNLTFGPGTNEKELFDLKSNVGKVKDVIVIIERLAKFVSSGGSFFNFLTSGNISLVFLIASQLISDAQKLHKKIERLEVNIYSTLLEGKLNALKSALNTIEHPATQSTQIICEVTVAIRSFEEILPIFTRHDSAMYKRYDLAGPIFVGLCGVFKIITEVAMQVPGYNSSTSDFERLRQNYKNCFKSYRLRCIRQRLRSIYLGNYVYSTLQKMFFLEDLLEFDEYFERSDVEETSFFKDTRDKGKEDFVLRVGPCPPPGTKLDPVLVDGWDTECLCCGTSRNYRTVTVIGNRDDRWSARVREYRRDVKKVMEAFFDEMVLW